MAQVDQKSHSATAELVGAGKARRVYLALRDRIDRGELPVGSVLPGEQKLAAEFAVARVTVRRALQALSDEGVVVRHVGRGSVVQPRPNAGHLSGDMATLMPQLYEMAERTEARLLSFSYGPPSEPVRTALGLAPGSTIQTAVRVRSFDGQPFSHLTTHVPEAIGRGYSEADLAATPMFRLLERAGRKIASAEQSVSAALAAPDVAQALHVAPGSALLSLTRTVCDADGVPVEYLTALYRPDMFRLSMQLHLVGGTENRHWEPLISTSHQEAAE